MAEREKKHNTLHKALEINLDNCKYGTIVEIGAGQEVVRQFFRAGGASGTIAKAISAYDKDFSNAIYGEENSLVQDKPKAFKLYTQACKGGSAKGCHNLGLVYFYGDGVEKDREKAFQFYRKGCKGGNMSSCYKL